MVNQPLWKHVAERLKGAIQGNESLQYPLSTKALAQSTGVSMATMRSAIKALVDEGVVVVRRGRGIEPVETKPLVTSVEHIGARSRGREGLFEWVSEKISDGTYRSGSQLPKAEFFIREHRVSSHTLQDVLRRLHTGNLIHKEGRVWIAGPASVKRAAHGVTHVTEQSPFVLVLQNSSHAWRDMYFHYRRSGAYYNFAAAFDRELISRGIGAAEVLPGDDPDDSCTVTRLAQGRAEIGDLLRRRGKLYQGCLVLCSPQNLENTDEWFQWLLSYRKPVAWFDRTSNGYEGLRKKPGFYWLKEDRAEACSVAIRTLAERGHRRVGFPLPKFYQGWSAPIADLLHKAATASRTGIEVVVYREDFDFFRSQPGGKTCLDTLVRLESHGTPAVRSAIRALFKWRPDLADSPLLKVLCPDPDLLDAHTNEIMSGIWLTGGLAPLLLDKGVTALIAPRSRLARYFYSWLLGIGVKVPEELSFISLEDSAQTRPCPISSVDTGFAELGYLAAQVFAGEIPVRRGTDGSVQAKARLIDRGSVTTPRKLPLKIDLDGEWY